MRRLIGLVLVCAASAAPAQQRTADDYVCLLSGECGDAAPARSGAHGRFAIASGPRAPVDLRLSFASGSATLTPAAQTEARVLAAALARPALVRRRLRIEGHTDSVGGRAANLSLSQRRATAVVAFLEHRGVARSRLVAVGYGPDRPLPDLPASAPANRRVVAALLP